MRDHPPAPRSPSTPRRVGRALLAAIGVSAGLLTIYSCSLIVETRSQQCQSDGDCAMFGAGSKCDPKNNVCLAPPTGSGGSTSSSTASSTSGPTSSSTSASSSSGAQSCDVDGGIDGGGCYDDSLAMCPATTNAEILNACTTGCIAFDNGQLTGLVDGGLPPLPTTGPDGGL